MRERLIWQQAQEVQEMAEMSMKRLKAYRSAKEEIGELRYKLEHLAESGPAAENCCSVYRADTGREDAGRLEEMYRSRLARLLEECREIEDFVESIPESLERRIFRMRYIEGRSQAEIAKKVHIDQSRVSRKISEYLKVAYHA